MGKDLVVLVGFSIVFIIPLFVAFAKYFGWFNRKEKQQGTRFLGIQLDIAILIVGLVLLLALIGWVIEKFF